MKHMKIFKRSGSSLKEAPETMKLQFRPGTCLPVEALLMPSSDTVGEQSSSDDDGDLQDGLPSADQDDPVLDAQETSGGQVYHAQIRLDSFKDPKECLESGELKPRRAIPQIKVSELFAGLKEISGRWIFNGPLNGWPALTILELRSLTRKRRRMFNKIQYVWRAGCGASLPEPQQIAKGTRATFVGQTWAAIGWAPDSPGFVFWYTEQRGGGPQIMYGEQLFAQLERDKTHGSAKATSIHLLAHRYPVATETVRDRNSWHAAVLLEWSHGLYTTLIELAWRSGLGGYGGKANWVEDKLEPLPKIYEVMPNAMKTPWCADLTEVRIYDLPAKTLEEFNAFVEKYSSRSDLPLKEQRFLEPNIYASSKVRLRSCTQTDIAGYMLNYASRAKEYGELTANCQTFVADLYSFLAGVKESQPYSMVVKPGYKQRSYSFLYMPRQD